MGVGVEDGGVGRETPHPEGRLLGRDPGWRPQRKMGGEMGGSTQIQPHSRGRWDGVGGAKRMGWG